MTLKDIFSFFNLVNTTVYYIVILICFLIFYTMWFVMILYNFLKNPTISFATIFCITFLISLVIFFSYMTKCNIEIEWNTKIPNFVFILILFIFLSLPYIFFYLNYW